MYELFLRYALTLRQLIKPSPNPLNNAFFAGSCYLVFIDTVISKIWSSCNSTIFSITILSISSLFNQTPTFCTQEMNNVCYYCSILSWKFQRLNTDILIYLQAESNWYKWLYRAFLPYFYNFGSLLIHTWKLQEKPLLQKIHIDFHLAERNRKRPQTWPLLKGSMPTWQFPIWRCTARRSIQNIRPLFPKEFLASNLQKHIMYLLCDVTTWFVSLIFSLLGVGNGGFGWLKAGTICFENAVFP